MIDPDECLHARPEEEKTAPKTEMLICPDCGQPYPKPDTRLHRAALTALSLRKEENT